MKNWKDKVLGIFAGIGVMSLLMASNSQTTTPDSHVWQIESARMGANSSPVAFLYNKKTGEVYKLNTLSQFGGSNEMIKMEIED